MRETLWVLAIVVVSCAVTAAGSLPALEIVQAGESVMLGCAVVGVPLQGVYFATLGLALHAGPAEVPAGWYWRPFAHHHLLTVPWRRLVIPCFAAGALAFVGIVLGVATVVLGMIAGLRPGG